MTNKEKYLENRQNVALAILNIGKINRKQMELDLRLAKAMGNLIDDQLNAWIENNELKERLNLMKNKTPEDEIVDKIDEKFAPYYKKIEESENKRKFADNYFTSRVTDEEFLENLDNIFLEVVKKNYPGLLLNHPTPMQMTKWRTCHFFYLNDKYDELVKIAEETQEPSIEGISEEVFDKLNTTMLKMIDELSKTAEGFKNKYPLDRENVINDEIELIKLEANYRQTTYDLKKESAELRKALATIM